MIWVRIKIGIGLPRVHIMIWVRITYQYMSRFVQVSVLRGWVNGCVRKEEGMGGCT